MTAPFCIQASLRGKRTLGIQPGRELAGGRARCLSMSGSRKRPSFRMKGLYGHAKDVWLSPFV